MGWHKISHAIFIAVCEPRFLVNKYHAPLLFVLSRTPNPCDLRSKQSTGSKRVVETPSLRFTTAVIKQDIIHHPQMVRKLSHSIHELTNLYIHIRRRVFDISSLRITSWILWGWGISTVVYVPVNVCFASNDS